MTYPETTKCVKCLKREAVCWHGYVLTSDGVSLLAGWCRYHRGDRGFVGHFKREMGHKP
mgnify:CR=1 FL=1